MPQFPIHNSKYFDVREWVDEKIWMQRNVKAAQMVDPVIVRIADLFREKAGQPVYINTWHTGGHFVASGFRAVWEKQGGKLSQHRCGRAVDLKVNGMNSVDMLGIVMRNLPEFLALGLTVIENVEKTPTWLHLDCRPRTIGMLDTVTFVDPV